MATFTATANVVTWTSTEDPRVVFRFVSADGESSGDGISQAQGDARYLQQSNDLSDVDDAATARTNLGLGSAATADADDFDVAPGFLVDALEGASNPWDLDGLVGNGTIVLLTTVTTVTLPDAADLPAGAKVRFSNGTAGALSLTVNCAGSDEFSSSATSINPTVPIGGTVVVNKMDTGIGFEWGWAFVGNVSGPTSATDSAIALFDGTTGKALKDSAVTISTDEDLTSDSDSKVPTEQAVKAYVDANAGGGGGPGVVMGALVMAEVGNYLTTPGMSAHGSIGIGSDTSTSRTRVATTPIPVQRGFTADRISIYCSTAATDAGGIVYLGYCPSDAGGLPDYANAVALGSVDVTSTGLKEITISEAFTAGLYWGLAAFATGGTEAGTNPDFYATLSDISITNRIEEWSNREFTDIWLTRPSDDGDVDDATSVTMFRSGTAPSLIRIALRVGSYT